MNDEIRMMNDETRMTKSQPARAFDLRHSVIHLSFAICYSSF